MTLQKKDFLELIRKGENSAVEFKREEVRAEGLAKEMVAFANQNGGVIFLGVEDDGTILGLQEFKNHEEWIVNIARNNVIPSIDVDCSVINIEDKKIVCAQIPKGKDRPYQMIDGKYYLRIGSSNRIATQQELLRLFQSSGVFHYDRIPVARTGLKDLNFTKLDQYFQRYSFDFSLHNDEEKKILLKNVDILEENGEVTLAGLLIFGINPSRYLPQSGISFACFSGNTIGEELLDKQDIDGTLDYQVDTGMAIIKSHLKRPSKIKNAKREEIKYIYPEKVFRELLTNAVVHRNYAIQGSKIRVFLFEDRLEIMSPGRLPNTVTIEKLRFGVSFAINPVLVKFMENLRYIDHLGRGLPMVYQEATQNGKKVEFQEFGEEFKVILEI